MNWKFQNFYLFSIFLIINLILLILIDELILWSNLFWTIDILLVQFLTLIYEIKLIALVNYNSLWLFKVEIQLNFLINWTIFNVLICILFLLIGILCSLLDPIQLLYHRTLIYLLALMRLSTVIHFMLEIIFPHWSNFWRVLLSVVLYF